MSYRQLIEAALVAVIDAVENPDGDEGLASAERIGDVHAFGRARE